MQQMFKEANHLDDSDCIEHYSWFDIGSAGYGDQKFSTYFSNNWIYWDIFYPFFTEKNGAIAQKVWRL